MRKIFNFIEFMLRNFCEEQRKIGDRQSGILSSRRRNSRPRWDEERPSEILTILRIKGVLEWRDRSRARARDRVLS